MFLFNILLIGGLPIENIHFKIINILNQWNNYRLIRNLYHIFHTFQVKDNDGDYASEPSSTFTRVGSSGCIC